MPLERLATHDVFLLSTATTVRARQLAYNKKPVSYTHLTLPTICSV